MDLLRDSLNAAVGCEPIAPAEAYGKLLAGHWHMFEFRGGILCVEIKAPRMLIVAFAGVNLTRRFKQFAWWLKKLAAGYGCDMIETVVFDTRLSNAIRRAGATVESVTLVLEV